MPMIADFPLVVRQPGSAQDVGPFLDVITWVLLITSSLAVLTRLVTKKALRRRVDIDDAFVVAALLTSIGSGIAVCIQTANGLGEDIALLTKSDVVRYEKSAYATKLLYIATLAFAKLSIISLLMILTASVLHRKVGITLATFIAAWGVVSEITAAFECGLKKPWNSNGPDATCLNMPAFWRATGIINMLTDLTLIFFPVHVIVTLQMSVGKRLTILLFFGARSLDIIATGIQLAYADAFNSPNHTRALWKWTLTTQIIQCITIVTSCIPYLRPLLESIPSGMYGADELRRRGTPSFLGYSKGKDGNYKLSDVSTSSGRSARSHVNGTRKNSMSPNNGKLTSHCNSASGIPGGVPRPDGENLGVEISAQYHVGERSWEENSTRSEPKIIKTTVVTSEWEEVEGAEEEASSERFTRHIRINDTKSSKALKGLV
ncbi:hypothetical protein GQ43DRAFT_496554 [Delitschia confertaspora ATCC 74209]|uniref:Rhodopsin domain-containing protein n=1 Tax=Delitschia confertaspora ATCC 74209 TaxID=1513339 RepID=A0A9P4JIS8_9PLEO|nr:hypothetical protein GQ43DRAFT_496554 [Delitschia confertaspora ATCC 74209]